MLRGKVKRPLLAHYSNKQFQLHLLRLRQKSIEHKNRSKAVRRSGGPNRWIPRPKDVHACQGFSRSRAAAARSRQNSLKLRFSRRGHDFTQACAIAQMLITPRLYGQSQIPDKGLRHDLPSTYGSLKSWKHSVYDYQNAAEMLLLHQTGSVRIGQVVR